MERWKSDSTILTGMLLDRGAHNTWEPVQWADGSSNGTLRGTFYAAQNWDRSPCILYQVQRCWGLGKYVLKHPWPQGQEDDDGQLICHRISHWCISIWGTLWTGSGQVQLHAANLFWGYFNSLAGSLAVHFRMEPSRPFCSFDKLEGLLNLPVAWIPLFTNSFILLKGKVLDSFAAPLHKIFFWFGRWSDEQSME